MTLKKIWREFRTCFSSNNDIDNDNYNDDDDEKERFGNACCSSPMIMRIMKMMMKKEIFGQILKPAFLLKLKITITTNYNDDDDDDEKESIWKYLMLFSSPPLWLPPESNSTYPEKVKIIGKILTMNSQRKPTFELFDVF